LLRVDAFLAAGQRDSAQNVMRQLLQQYPQNARVQARADTMGVKAGAAAPAPTTTAPPAAADTVTTTR
jgi:hypothetical protein